MAPPVKAFLLALTEVGGGDRGHPLGDLSNMPVVQNSAPPREKIMHAFRNFYLPRELGVGGGGTSFSI